ncbi:MAG: SAM-dependent chlorinase/fluorinase, partial [Chloroflexota bacterium]
MPRPLVTLLTDFGLRDPSAAICRAVILGIAPDVDVIDISHEVRKFAIRDGALLLLSALPYVPIGFHVAVIDPGVGTARRPVAIRVTRGDVLVVPDNGLLL